MELFLFIEIRLYQKDLIIINISGREINIAFYEPNKYTIHAEQSCIQKCKDKTIIRKCKLIIVKIDKNNNIINCKPCSMCNHIINKYKVRRVLSLHF